MAQKELDKLAVTTTTALIFHYIVERQDAKQIRRGCKQALGELPPPLLAMVFPAVREQAKLGMQMKL